MTREEVRDAYFDWMYGLVCNNSRYSGRGSFRKLLSHLDDAIFEYSIPMDANREADGLELRYRFGYDQGIDSRIVASCLDDQKCSVLEMMIALSVRCEEHIMGDPDIGDQTGKWFWGMIENLGLGHMPDTFYNDKAVDEALDRLINRTYAPNGEGGLFTVENCRGRDLRDVEIWYQMNWYLCENM